MEKLHVKIFSLTLTFTAVLGVTVFAQAQTAGGVTVAVNRGPHPAWEGKAAGDVQSFERNNDDLKIALLSQATPDIWLEFAESRREGHPSTKSSKDEAIIKVALPSEAKSILKLFWDEALKFDYNEAFIKAQSAQEAYDRDIAWINKCTASIVRLEQVEIDAADGKRKISDLEAEDLVYFARRASANLVNQAKEKRKNGKIARFNPPPNKALQLKISSTA
jgi:hypothetical protein